MKGVKLETRPVSWLKFASSQIRQQIDLDAQRRLRESIELYGILQPPGVKPDGTIVWGNRRGLVAIDIPLKEITVAVLYGDMTETDYLLLQAIENVQREAVTPYELFLACMKLLELQPDWGNADLARYLSLDPSSITRLVSAAKGVPDVQQAFAAGKLNLTQVYAISKAAPELQLELLDAALNGATRDALEQIRKKKPTPSIKPEVKSIETVSNGAEPKQPSQSEGGEKKAVVINAKPVRTKLVLPSGISITVSGTGLDLNVMIEALADAKQKAERGREGGFNINNIGDAFKADLKASQESKV